MSTLKEIAQEIQKHKENLKNANDRLFKDNVDLLLERIKSISECLIMGGTEPTTCCDELNIPWSTCNMSIKEMKDNKYPCSEIKWDVENGMIEARITAVFRGEEDSSYNFTFPADTIEFENYLKKIKDEGMARIPKQTEVDREKEKILRGLELSQLAYLQNKYADTNETKEKIK